MWKQLCPPQSYQCLKHFTRTFANLGQKTNVKPTKTSHGYGDDLTSWSSQQQLCEHLLENKIYEDAHILVLNKPAGLPMFGPKQEAYSLTGPANPKEFSIASLLESLKETRNAEIMIPAFSQHRLYSGIVVLSKTARAREVLSKYFLHTKTHNIHHIKYRAVTVGVPNPAQSDEQIIFALKYMEDHKICVKVKDRIPVSNQAKARKLMKTNFKMDTVRVSKSSQYQVALVDLSTTRFKWDAVQVYLLHKFAPALGDHNYSGRLHHIARTPVIKRLEDHDHLHSRQILPFELRKRLGLTSDEDTSTIPLHIHCHQLTLPRINPKRGHSKSDRVHLEASLPDYYNKTLSLLGLHAVSSENEDFEESLNSAEALQLHVT